MSPHPRKIVGIIQARMGSTRLPGKVLSDIDGQPMLMRVHDRTRRASSLDQLLVATTSLQQDDPIVEFCQGTGIEVFRGHPTDVLDRFYRAAKAASATVVVRLTADCPLIDPDLIDQTVQLYLRTDPPVDFAANRLPWDRSFPIGLDVEVCSSEALAQAWESADQPHQREHVMPYLYENQGRFRIALLKHPEDLSRQRWTVDEQADLELVRKIYAAFDGRDDFSWGEVRDLMLRRPDLERHNSEIQQRGLRS